MKAFKIILILLTAPMFTYAGWTSGGGEILADAHNPWFLNNTKVIKYCVQVDEQNFGLSKSQIQPLIKKSFDFWKYQFQQATTRGNNGLDLRPAQSVFIEEACQASTDIRFQFGVLDGDQFQYMKDPTQFLGLSVRTDYDPASLKGRGFIYISPESGPIKFNSKNIIEKPWSSTNGYLLYPVILHELGHVFGLQHTNDIFLMKEDYPEQLLSNSKYNYEKRFWEFLFDKPVDLISLFKFKANLGTNGDRSLVCEAQSSSRQNSSKIAKSENLVQNFFSLEKSDDCVSWDFDGVQMNFFAGKANEMKLIGTGQVVKNDRPTLKEAVKLWLPKEQKVIPENSIFSQKITLAYMQSSTQFKGTYQSTDGKTQRNITIQADSSESYIKLGGVHNGISYFDLSEGF